MNKIYIAFDDNSVLERGLPSGVSHEPLGDDIYSMNEGRPLPAGARLASDEESASLHSAMSELKAQGFKLAVQSKLVRQYGVSGKPMSAPLSIIGKIGDATSLGLDLDVQDILSVEATKTAAYSKERIRLFEELYGDDSWVAAVKFSKEWHAGRVTKEIQVPLDGKGIASVVAESASLGRFVKQGISAAAESQAKAESLEVVT